MNVNEIHSHSGKGFRRKNVIDQHVQHNSISQHKSFHVYGYTDDKNISR